MSATEVKPAQHGPYQYWMASLAPRVITSSAQVQALDAVVLYSSDAASTTLELAPGHWARIRAKASLQFREPENIPTTPSSEVRLGAVWSLFRVYVSEQNGTYHATFVPVGEQNPSTNTLPIRLLPGK